MTILVTGSNGQLGSELRELSSAYPQARFHFFDRQSFPIQDEAAARKVMAEVKPDYLVNCAAYTAVDLAESEREQANAINGTAVGVLARLCRETGCRLIHVSTDYVFDGTATEPLKEEQPVAPVNAYGASKLLGEQLAQKENADTIIIRTSWVYSFYGKNFVRTMLRLMSERPEISVVADQWGSPTYAADLAKAIMEIITSGNWVPGIYHYSNEGTITWHQFALAIREGIGSSCLVHAIPTEKFPTPAKRPAYSVMDKSKIKATFSLHLPDWKESLQICLRKMREGVNA